MGRRSQADNISVVDNFLVGVESDKSIFLRHVDAIEIVLVELTFQPFARTVQSVLEGIGHRHQFYAGICIQSLRCGPCSTTATSNQAKL